MIDSHFEELVKLSHLTSLPLSGFVDVYYNKQVDKYLRSNLCGSQIDERAIGEDIINIMKRYARINNLYLISDDIYKEPNNMFKCLKDTYRKFMS